MHLQYKKRPNITWIHADNMFIYRQWILNNKGYAGRNPEDASAIVSLQNTSTFNGHLGCPDMVTHYPAKGKINSNCSKAMPIRMAAMH